MKKLPAGWGYQYQANPAGDGGTYECNNRKNQADDDGSDVIDTILVLQAPAPDPANPPTQAEADKYVRNWMQPFDPGA